LILQKTDSFFFYKTRVPLELNKDYAKKIRHLFKVFFAPDKTIPFGLIHIDASWKRLQSNHRLEA
jgi:hypothetical protein